MGVYDYYKIVCSDCPLTSKWGPNENLFTILHLTRSIWWPRDNFKIFCKKYLVCQSAFLEVLLMIFFRLIEFWCWFDLYYYSSIIKFARLIYSFFRFLSHSLLFFIMKEYRRSILCYNIRSLSIRCCWVMVIPKYI